MNDVVTNCALQSATTKTTTKLELLKQKTIYLQPYSTSWPKCEKNQTLSVKKKKNIAKGNILKNLSKLSPYNL